MKIPDASKRIELARRFARNGTSRKAMLKAINHVLAQMKAMGQAELPAARPATNGHHRNGHANGHGLNGATKKGAPVEPGIPARKIILLAAGTLCEGCRLDGLTQKCWTCPGPYELVQSLVEMAEFRAEAETATDAVARNGVQG
jgi:hypothetical protein